FSSCYDLLVRLYFPSFPTRRSSDLLLFCYFVVLPFALNFLVQYGIDSGFVPQLSIAAFVGFMLWFLLVFGLMFELPLAISPNTKDRKSTRLNSSHVSISYAVFCLKK